MRSGGWIYEQKGYFGGQLWVGQDENPLAPQGSSRLPSLCYNGPQSSVVPTRVGTILFKLDKVGN